MPRVRSHVKAGEAAAAYRLAAAVSMRGSRAANHFLQKLSRRGFLGAEALVKRLGRACRAGDQRARERLVSRFLPILRNWATGRLPGGARDLAETDDLVQITLVRALDHIDRFEHRGEGAFLAYLRRILLKDNF